jgi:H+-transporting ATPase
LFVPAFSTRIIGTLIACYRFFMAPVGWTYTAYIWIYAPVWFVFNDFVKVLTYSVMRRNRWARYVGS